MVVHPVQTVARARLLLRRLPQRRSGSGGVMRHIRGQRGSEWPLIRLQTTSRSAGTLAGAGAAVGTWCVS